MTHRLVKLIRGALLPTTLPQAERSLYGGWENKTELTGAWLTQIIHIVRCSLVHWLCAIFTWFYTCILHFEAFLSLSLWPSSFRGCHEALSALEIPNDLLQVIQDLLLDLRVHCLMMTLLHTTEGEAGLKSRKSNGGKQSLNTNMFWTEFRSWLNVLGLLGQSFCLLIADRRMWIKQWLDVVNEIAMLIGWMTCHLTHLDINNATQLIAMVYYFNFGLCCCLLF